MSGASVGLAASVVAIGGNAMMGSVRHGDAGCVHCDDAERQALSGSDGLKKEKLVRWGFGTSDPRDVLARICGRFRWGR
jgi:hypothetical protein